MRNSSRMVRRSAAATVALVATGMLGVIAGFGSTPAAVGSVQPAHRAAVSTPATAAPTTSMASTTTSTAAPVVVAPRVTPIPAVAPAFASGNARLDALLATLPRVLFAAHAHVHFGYNPLDECCHAGGYNPGPNDVWVSERAFSSTARLTYVAAHELGHSLHLHSTRGPALTAAVAGAPVVRAGSPWDVSEKVADCVAWVLYPAQTAASGITYWSCPDPWRSRVRAALQ
jgi:hypothetical protein